jgi:ribosomal protein S18 acetylase RimI-like enzyme
MLNHLKETQAGRHISLGLVRPNGTVEGHVFILFTDTEKPVYGIGIQDRVQGQGWGKKLSHAVLAEADRMEKPLVTLTVVKANTRAQKLYETLGFVRKGEETFKTPNDSLYMERRIH